MSVLFALMSSTVLGAEASASQNIEAATPVRAADSVPDRRLGSLESTTTSTPPVVATVSTSITTTTLVPSTTVPSTTSAPVTTNTTTPTTTPTTTIPAGPTPLEIEAARLPRDVVVEFAGVVSFSFGASAQFDATPVTREDCIRQAKTSPLKIDGLYDRNLIAQMTHRTFDCLTSAAGLDTVAPTALRRWNGAAKWGFGSLADQVSAEAVVVAYCESKGFSPSALTGSNGFGYAGLFQMGSTEMARFGEPGSSRFDPVDNAVGAANYFIYQYRNRAGWGGWSPWAVVNTNFDDEVNNQVKVPVLPRFTSTDPEFRGRPGPELPAWAVDPWSWFVPHYNGTGCPFNGGRWPGASALGG
ncbi:MAG TPA: hypothetical protein VMS74_06470 [Acidimicrobiia bacterium]|nr:hypothetical protein [Acidimicrobiia bacterium]